MLRAVTLTACLVVGAAEARAYDFQVRATTVGQAYQLRSFRPNRAVLLLSRNRLTQALDVTITDIPGWQQRRLQRHQPPGGGLESIDGRVFLFSSANCKTARSTFFRL